MKQTEYLRELRHTLLKIKGEVLRDYYYLESGELHYKPDPSRWSIIEIFEHVNIINYHYLRNISRALLQAEDTEEDSFNPGWLGRLMVKYMKPSHNKVRFKLPAFRKTDPRYRRKKGYALVDHVVFQDFVDGTDQLISLLEKAEQKELDKVKVPTFLPFLRINTGDALAFATAHIERHMLQARQSIKKI